jgi:hypothetical protein
MDQTTQDLWDTLLSDLQRGIIDARTCYLELQVELNHYVECHSLNEARRAELDGKRPYWPAVPSSEVETTRNGQPSVYVYLYWSAGQGPRPGGKEPQARTYVGSKPHRIQLARRMVANHHTQRKLRRQIHELRWNVHSTLANLQEACQLIADTRQASRDLLQEDAHD